MSGSSDIILERDHPRIISVCLAWIGFVVSEEKIFKISSPFFLFLAWRPSWFKGGVIGHNYGRGPPKEHSTKVGRAVSEEKIFFVIVDGRTTDDRRRTPSDDKSSHGLWPGELIKSF